MRDPVNREIHNMRPGWWMSWGIVMLSLTVLLIIVSSYFIRYPDVIVAEARLLSSTPSTTIPVKRNSRIVTVIARDGEKVSANGYLFVLENNSDLQDVLKIRTIIDHFDLNHDLDTVFRSEADNKYKLGDIQESWDVLIKALFDHYEIVEKKKYDNEIEGLKKELAIRKSLKYNLRQVVDIDKNINSATKQNRMADSTLFSQTVISKGEYNNLSKSYYEDQKTQQLGRLNFEKSSLDVTQLQNNIVDLIRTNEERMMDLNIRIRVALNNLNIALATWEENYVIKSPISGKVSYLLPITENAHVVAGENLVTITTGVSDYRVMLKIPFDGAGKIRSGQEVNIKLTDFPSSEYGVLIGKIERISAVADQDHYLGYVRLNSPNKTSYNKTIDIKENTSGVAEIITKNRSLLERVMEKLIILFKK